MKNISVNTAFTLLDETLRYQIELATKVNTHSSSPTFFGCNTAHNPEEYGCSVVKENELLWITNERDHNDYLCVFVFKTTEVYRNTALSLRESILEESETRKVLLKNDVAEVGITIEESLNDPNENIWGFRFRGFKYYIIKDGKTTITEKRSTIRKIYNNRVVENNSPYLVQIDGDKFRGTYEVEGITQIRERVFECTIDDEEYYIADDRSLRDYFIEYIADKDFKPMLISMLGGVDEIVERFISGNTYNPEHFLMFDEGKNICMVLSIDIEFLQAYQHEDIEHSNFDFDNELSISGLQLYKKIM
jgi:hypothetical protein